jgi:(2S)-methylsuccinyl-CoA dehydrogenase
MGDELRAASAAVELAGTVVNTAVARLAALANDNGKISVAKLDRHQAIAYDLAHAAAAVEGSRVMCSYGEHGEVESMLARAYVADAVHDVATRALGRS